VDFNPPRRYKGVKLALMPPGPPALKASLVRETNASSPTLPVGIGGSDVTSVQEERASGERKRVFCL